MYGNGSVYKDKVTKKWCVMYYDYTGKRHKKVFGASNANHEEARNFSKKNVYDRTVGTAINPTKLSLGEWMLLWLNTYKKSKVEATTFNRYVSVSANLEPISYYRLSQLNPIIIQNFYNDLVEKGYKASTLALLHHVLNGAIKKAVALHLIQYSPLTNVELPRIKKPKIEIFTDEEIARIKEVLKEYKYRLYKDYFLTLMYTGARPSEILALQFSNIKVERNTVYICRNRKNLNGEVYGAPKTAAGMREIPIPEELTRELIKSHQNEKISDLNGLLFKTVYGHSVSLERIEKAWQSIRKAAKIPKGKTLYTFRHTYATKLLSSNISPMEVARLMGHSNPSITFNRYGHCIPNYNEVILKKISNLY